MATPKNAAQNLRRACLRHARTMRLPTSAPFVIALNRDRSSPCHYLERRDRSVSRPFTSLPCNMGCQAHEARDGREKEPERRARALACLATDAVG